MANSPFLEIHNLHASVAGNEILRGVDLTVNRGEVHAVMVVTPMANGEVELPKATQPEAWPAEPSRSKITLEFGDPPRISLDNDPGPLSVAALEALLRAIRAGYPGREIVLRADRRLPYAEVKRVIQTVQDAGFPAVGLVAERRR